MQRRARLDDTSLHTAHRDGSNATNLVHILRAHNAVSAAMPPQQGPEHHQCGHYPAGNQQCQDEIRLNYGADGTWCRQCTAGQATDTRGEGGAQQMLAQRGAPTWRGRRRGLSEGLFGGSIRSRASSSVGPLYQGRLVERSIMLSPWKPEMGTKLTCAAWAPSLHLAFAWGWHTPRYTIQSSRQSKGLVRPSSVPIDRVDMMAEAKKPPEGG